MAKKISFGTRSFAMLLCFLVWNNKIESQQVVPLRNYLSSELKSSRFVFSQTELAEWNSRQKESYLKKIEQLPDSVKASFIKNADKALLFDWPSLRATDFLQYKQSGNRTGFQNKQDERRDCLNRLVIGELITHNKKYLPQIINGVWATLEESTWEIPAIVSLQKIGTDLPDPSEQIIGLVSAETAVMLATIQNMLGEEFTQYSPVINKRISVELHKRILDPYLQRNDFWWMGFKGQSVNNWNAWINTNVLETALLTEKDPDSLALLINKIFRSTDFFINQYPNDGGCDEGPAYWSIAGGRLIRFLHLAGNFSNGKLDWSGISLLHNIGSYIYKMHIAGSYFVNFADATPSTIPDPASVYRFGEMFKDDTLKHFAAFLFSLKKRELPDNSVVNFLETVAVFDQLTTLAPTAPLPSSSFLPDLQVLTARSSQGSTTGLFLAVQGGNNGESHNHNDVGNFILYSNGQPVIIDAGVGTYTAQTFSDRRYELWNMQSQWHNDPVINGVMQKDGKEFKAGNVFFKHKSRSVNIGMDISAAYPLTASVKHWERDFLFDQAKNRITLSEKYLLDTKTGETKINFLTACKIKEEKKGKIIFYNPKGEALLVLGYDPSLMHSLVDEKILEDEKIIGSWGKKLVRLSMVVDGNLLSGDYKFKFSIPE